MLLHKLAWAFEKSKKVIINILCLIYKFVRVTAFSMVLVFYRCSHGFGTLEGYEIGGIIRIGWRDQGLAIHRLDRAPDSCLAAVWPCPVSLSVWFTATDFALLFLQIWLVTLVYLLNKCIDPTSVSQPVPAVAHAQRSFSNEIFNECSSYNLAEKWYRIEGKRTHSLETGCLDPNLSYATY